MKWFVRYTWEGKYTKTRHYKEKYYKTKKEALNAMELNYCNLNERVRVCEFIKIDKDKEIVQTIPRRYL